MALLTSGQFAIKFERQTGIHLHRATLNRMLRSGEIQAVQLNKRWYISGDEIERIKQRIEVIESN